MAFDYVTSKQGKPHVTAAQMGALQAATIGSGRYVLKEYADGLAVSMTDANTLSIAAGALAIDGRYVVNDEPTTVKIANGGQSSYRHDLVVLTIKDDPSTGIGSVGVSVAQGAAASSAAAAKDPSVVEGSMLGGNVATCPIARIKLDGLTPTCELMLKSVGSLAALGESVSQPWKPPFTTSTITLSRCGNIVTLSGNVKFEQSGVCNYMKVSESIPLGFRPTTDNQSAVFAMPTDRMALLVNADGQVSALGNPSSAYACCSGCWVTSDEWPS